MNQQLQGAAQKFGKIGLGGIAMGAIDVASEYYFRRKDNPNESQLVSLGAAGLSAAAWALFPGVMGIKMAGEIGGALAAGQEQAYRAYKEQMYAAAAPNFGGGFQDTAFASTSRQRGLQAIQSARLNARSAFGGEARSLHRF